MRGELDCEPLGRIGLGRIHGARNAEVSGEIKAAVGVAGCRMGEGDPRTAAARVAWPRDASAHRRAPSLHQAGGLEAEPNFFLAEVWRAWSRGVFG